MKIKYIIGAAVISVFTYLAVISFEGKSLSYVTIEEAIHSGEAVQVKGKRLDNGRFDIKDNVFLFTMEDEKGNQLNVVYDGAKPGNFDQATELVCQGQYRDGKFYAHHILVKCPSKYVDEGAQT